MFSLSESKKVNEENKRCGLRKKILLAAPNLPVDMVNPGPHDQPPGTLGEAKNCKYWEGFEGAIESELTQSETNRTWDYVEWDSLPRNTNILRAKFVFDIKRRGEREFLK